MAFAKGGQAAREEVKKSLPSFNRVKYLSLSDGESIFIRLIDDSPDWIYIQQHGFVPTKGAPKDWEAKDGKKWPASMNAVCRKAKNQGDLVFPEHGGKCFICDEMTGSDKKDGKYRPSIKLWARAIVRDEIIGTEAMASTINPDTGLPLIEKHEVGQRVGFQDHEIEVQDTDKDGKPVGDPKTQAEVIVLNMGMKNFFGALQASYDAYGTVLDRDYKITRHGEKLDTEYDIVPMDPIMTRDEATGRLVKFTLQKDEIREPYEKLLDLEEVITEQASDRHYATFFDTTKEIPTRAKKDDKAEADESGTGTQEQAPEPPKAEELAAMRDRMLNLTPAQAPAGS
jgi:hypothetical protein